MLMENIFHNINRVKESTVDQFSNYHILLQAFKTLIITFNEFYITLKRMNVFKRHNYRNIYKLKVY